MRRAPKGAALWTPAGVLTPDPGMLRIPLRLRAGRGLGFGDSRLCTVARLPKAGQAGRVRSLAGIGFIFDFRQIAMQGGIIWLWQPRSMSFI